MAGKSDSLKTIFYALGANFRDLRVQARRCADDRFGFDDGRSRALARRLRESGPAADRHAQCQARSLGRASARFRQGHLFLVVSRRAAAVQRRRHVFLLRGNAQTGIPRAFALAMDCGRCADLRPDRRIVLDVGLHARGQQGPRRYQPLALGAREPAKRIDRRVRRRPRRSDRVGHRADRRGRDDADRQPGVRRHSARSRSAPCSA
jgi:hypothetical protein